MGSILAVSTPGWEGTNHLSTLSSQGCLFWIPLSINGNQYKFPRMCEEFYWWNSTVVHRLTGVFQTLLWMLLCQTFQSPVPNSQLISSDWTVGFQHVTMVRLWLSLKHLWAVPERPRSNNECMAFWIGVEPDPAIDLFPANSCFEWRSVSNLEWRVLVAVVLWLPIGTSSRCATRGCFTNAVGAVQRGEPLSADV